MKSLLLATAMILGTQALADGFVCDNEAGNLRMKVYHQTQPELGTRNASILVISDPSIGAGHKTIATFSNDQTLLTNLGATYTADVDLRYKTSDRKGENIGGTKLGQLDQIVLSVQFSFAKPVNAGEQVPGTAVLVRRSGQDIHVDMTCTRYLKN